MRVGMALDHVDQCSEEVEVRRLQRPGTGTMLRAWHQGLQVDSCSDGLKSSTFIFSYELSHSVAWNFHEISFMRTGGTSRYFASVNNRRTVVGT